MTAPRIRALGVVLGLALSLGGAGTAAASAAAPAKPQLSIAIDDGKTVAKTGDALTYTITVTNLGTTAIKQLRISQTVPSGLSFTSADTAGAVTAGSVRWSVTLKPAGKAVLHTSMTVTPTGKDVLRLAAVACASVTATSAPIVCASHSDQLPAGAAAAAKTGHTASSSSGRAWWIVGGGVVAVLLIAGVALALRRQRARSLG